MEEQMTLTPQAQARLKELEQLGAESISVNQIRQPKTTPGTTVFADGVLVSPDEDVVAELIQIIGTSGDDILNGTDGVDEIFGLEGNDDIASFLSDDYIDAGSGKKDRVVAGGGNDRVDGGPGIDIIAGDFNPNADPDSSAMGDDTLNGGSGEDFLFGQNGNDILNGDNGIDELYGGNGDDTLNGGSGNDIAEGGNGNDNISGASGDDIIRGGDGNDILDGGSGKDKIFGGRGNDLLFGRTQDDELRGELGNDQLEGGRGNDTLIGADATTVLPVPELGFGKDDIDTLTGNQNNDTFVLGTQIQDGRDFRFYNDANPGNAGLQDYALITDFGLFGNTQNLGLDKIQLAGLKSNYSLGVSPSGLPSGTGIFFQESAQAVPELIGIVQNVSPSQLNLNNPSQFTFVESRKIHPVNSDLVVNFGDILQQPTIFPDEQGKVNIVVTNQGNTEFNGPVNLNLYSSTDNELDINNLNTLGPERGANDPLQGTDELLGILNNQNINLAPGQSQTFTVDFAGSEFRTPSVVSRGLYYLFAEVQPGNNITENKANNLANQLITQGDVVIQWNSILLNAIQASGKGDAPGTAPPLAARNQAIAHAAIYDAVNAFDNSHQPYLANIDPPQGASVEAAAVGAAYRTLVELFPLQKPTFDEQRNRSLNQITDDPAAEEAGFNFGVEVANQILAARRNDNSAQAGNVSYRPGNDPGDFQLIAPDFQPQPTQPNPNAVLPGWGLVTPFAIPNVSQFRPEGPPEFSSPLYGREIEEVRQLGAKFDTAVTKITRTPDQTEIAQFWAYDRDDTFRPPGQWNQIAQAVALENGNTLAENARLFALLNIAQADAGIVAWDAKYIYDQLRPITAIRDAENDNNPVTQEDQEWDSLIGTPNFPDYISGHSVFGGASAQVLARFFGNDNISFDIPSQELPGVSRSYSSFSQAANEDAISRVYGGVHVDLSTVDGVGTGQNVGNFVFDNFLA